jgi:hypothetical protein
MHRIALSVALLVAQLLPSTAGAQDPQPAPKPQPASDKYQVPPKQDAAAKPQTPDKTAKGAFTPEQLEQIVAPIALYSDPLLTQTLMASTYPLEIVQAARWVQKNPTLKGDALEKALQDQTWDPAVKSICGLPEVLKRLDENLDWTQDLGDAFLADQAALMDAVQRMRQKAQDAGHLKTTEQQKVTQREDKIIVIEPANPEVVYVPTYYPTAVYGSWSYPYCYYPPMYPAYPPGYPAFTFAVGVAWGAAMWGGCSWGWGHTDVDINIDHHNTFVDRTESADRRADRQQNRGDGKFQHKPEHRQGVRYRDTATAQKFEGKGGAGVADRATRDAARGYGGAARPSTGAVGGNRPSTGAASRPSTGASSRPSTGSASRPSTTSGTRSGSFSGARSPSTDRAASQRGSSSRGSSSRGGGSRGGGGRGGGRR